MENSYIFVALFAVTLAIYSLIDISLKKYTFKTRLIWLPIVILIPLLGPLAYFIKRKTIATAS